MLARPLFIHLLLLWAFAMQSVFVLAFVLICRLVVVGCSVCSNSQLLSGGVLGALSWLLITKYNAMKSAAAVTAEPAATKNHACHAGIKVCKYRKEPMRKNREADPAIEIPSDINTAPVML